jgi:hypothetical protein
MLTTHFVSARAGAAQAPTPVAGGAFGSSDLAQRARSVHEKECRRSSFKTGIAPAAPLATFTLAPATDAGHLDSDGVLCAAGIAAFEASQLPVTKELEDATRRKCTTTDKYGGAIGKFNRFLVRNNFGDWFYEVEAGKGDWVPRKRASGELSVVPAAFITFYLLACATGGYTTTQGGVTQLTGARTAAARSRRRFSSSEVGVTRAHSRKEQRQGVPQPHGHRDLRARKDAR